MKTIKFEKNIYPDVDDNFTKTIDILEKFGIKMEVLFDEGLSFTYDEEKYDIYTGDGLIFLEPQKRSQVLKVINCFGEITILDSQDEEISKLILFEESLL